MKYRAILFDFNGLIIDDEAIHLECFQRILSGEEITLADKDYWQTYVGFDDKGLFTEIFKRDGKKLTPKKLKMLVEEKAALYLPILKKKLKFFPGVADFIRQVQKDHPLAIVSGALRPEIDFALNEGEITDAFSVIVSAEDTKQGKPDPQGYLVALAKLKNLHPEIRPENCLALEDSHAGIIAAKRARIPVCALTHTYGRGELGDADLVADSFEEVLLVHGISTTSGKR